MNNSTLTIGNLIGITIQNRIELNELSIDN
jgi:hypothetical protein